MATPRCRKSRIGTAFRCTCSSVAAACARAAADESGSALPVLDGTDRINEYSGQPKATGLTDALEWGRVQAVNFYDWARVEVPKFIDSVQSKIEETKG